MLLKLEIIRTEGKVKEEGGGDSLKKKEKAEVMGCKGKKRSGRNKGKD